MPVRPQSYLRDEYLRRLDSGKPVNFCLQAQFHDVKPAAGSDEVRLGKSCWYNPTSPWFESAWVDIASLSFYSPLPPSAMSFSTDCVPAPVISIPDPADEADFNSVAAVATAMEAERLSLVVSQKAPEAGDEGTLEMTDYLVYCVTGDRLDAGTNANIHISVIGMPPCFDSVTIKIQP